MQAWKARVIARKSLEQDASDFFDRKAVLCVRSCLFRAHAPSHDCDILPRLCSSAFKRWTAQAYAADDRLVLAYEHRAVKLEGAPASPRLTSPC